MRKQEIACIPLDFILFDIAWKVSLKLFERDAGWELDECEILEARWGGSGVELTAEEIERFSSKSQFDRMIRNATPYPKAANRG